ncbi:MAG: peroxidase family protein [Synechococcales bacterium]|nr:heme peroxidase [Cyanobacteria bacterium REEB444]MEB3126342.1 peroxidase family protein [Synechococcales bacterium]
MKKSQFRSSINRLSRRALLGTFFSTALAVALPTPSLSQWHRRNHPRHLHPLPPTGWYERLFPRLRGASFNEEDIARLAIGDGFNLTGMTSEPEVIKDKKSKQPKRDAQGNLLISATEEDKQDEEENFGVPSGYTYFGQFIDHDLTLNPEETFGGKRLTYKIVNLRTPRFDLDSIYGGGPSGQPYLYESDGRHLIVGRGLTHFGKPFNGRDHQRINGRALIGDKRNDENVIISQLHAVFVAFHNRVADDHPNADFIELRRIVTWHYQWVVLTDFLPRIVGIDLMATLLPGLVNTESLGDVRLFLKISQQLSPGRIPLEFGSAAFRFGHSMIRPVYRLNTEMKGSEAEHRINPNLAGRRLIFAASQYGGLNGFREFPKEWGIDWKLFFEIDRSMSLSSVKDGIRRVQPAYKFDTSLANPLAFLPEFSEFSTNGDLARDQDGMPRPRPGLVSNLAHRNLLRGLQHDLPSGQDVSRAMGLDPIPDRELMVGKATVAAMKQNKSITEYGDSFKNTAPLWFYILAEAQHYWRLKTLASTGNEDECNAIPSILGPVGGQIVAESIVSLIFSDPESILHAPRGWRSPYVKKHNFHLPELVGLALS